MSQLGGQSMGKRRTDADEDSTGKGGCSVTVEDFGHQTLELNLIHGGPTEGAEGGRAILFRVCVAGSSLQPGWRLDAYLCDGRRAPEQKPRHNVWASELRETDMIKDSKDTVSRPEP